MRDRDIAKWVADRIGALRKAGKLSLRELARRSSLGAEVVSRAERGLQTPSIQTLERICDGLGTSLGEFFSQAAGKPASAGEIRRLQGLLGSLDREQRRQVLDGLVMVVKGIRDGMQVESLAKIASRSGSGRDARRLKTQREPRQAS